MPFDPYDVSDRGRKVYERLRRRLEAEHQGKFVAIDVQTEKYFLADSPEDAFRAARKAHHEGPFHFVRIGHEGVYRSTRLSRWRRRTAS
jgi:hypothetical protein